MGKSSLKDKVTIITGAGDGIGKATAKLFAEDGAKVVLVGRTEEKLKNTMKEILSEHADLSIEKEVEKIKDDLPKDFQQVDILINNAGLALGYDKCIGNKMKNVEYMMDTNFNAVVKLVTMFLPDMIKRDSGHIINVGSIAGYESYPGGSIYCATKFALRAYTTSLRMELINTKIRVSMVSPGLVETNFSVLRNFGDVEKAKQVYKGYEPLLGEDIADNIHYMATRRENVQIGDIIVFPTNQGSVYHVHKNL